MEDPFKNSTKKIWAPHATFKQPSPQGCAGRPFIPRGGAGRGKGKNPRGGAGRGGAKVKIRGAGRGEKARKSTNSKILQKCEKYNITYYNINYNIIIIL